MKPIQYTIAHRSMLRFTAFAFALLTSVGLAWGQKNLFGNHSNDAGGFLGNPIAENVDPTIPNHDPAKEVDLGDGLIIVDLIVGFGDKLVDGDLVVTDLNGWVLSNGKLFNSTHKPNTPKYARVIPSPGKVIEGLNRGLIGMKVGGTRKIIVPAALGYGEGGFPKIGIPPAADLVFEIELHDVVRQVEFDTDSANEEENGTLWIDVREGNGPVFVDNGFAACYITLWNHDGRFMGTSYGQPRPMMIKPDNPRAWVAATKGMTPGGRRSAIFNQQRPISSEKYREAKETGVEVEPEFDQWNVIIDMVEVLEPLTIPEYDSADLVDLGDGLYIVDLVVGEGTEMSKHGVPFVDYTGWLEDGTIFDSTKIPGREPRFVARGLDIKALSLGVMGMNEGGKRLMLVPAELGYGEDGSDKIGVPPSADLIFVIELIRWEEPLFLPVEDGDGGWGALEKALEEKEMKDMENEGDDAKPKKGKIRR